MRIILLLNLLITFNVDALNIYQSYAVEYDGELKLNTQLMTQSSSKAIMTTASL